MSIVFEKALPICLNLYRGPLGVNIHLTLPIVLYTRFDFS